ncbi:unnamed protein product, partial [Iphiclides podalirius]
MSAFPGLPLHNEALSMGLVCPYGKDGTGVGDYYKDPIPLMENIPFSLSVKSAPGRSQPCADADGARRSCRTNTKCVIFLGMLIAPFLFPARSDLPRQRAQRPISDE